MFWKKMSITIMLLFISMIILPSCSPNTIPPIENGGINQDGNNDLENTATDEDYENEQGTDETPPSEAPDEDNEEYIEIEKEQAVLALVNLNVRSTPTTQDNNKLGLLYQGAQARLIGIANSNWYLIDYYGAEAYVSTNTSYTKLIDIDLNDHVPAKIIDNVINIGMSILGVPYEYGSQRILLWGGAMNPNFTGYTYDCSAFVQYAFFIGAGIKLQGDSRSQSQEGMYIPLNQIQRGDLIFMTTTMRQNWTGIERIGHVAIYLGNDQILHTFGTGGVRVQTYSGFWEGRGIHARRMVL